MTIGTGFLLIVFTIVLPLAIGLYLVRYYRLQFSFTVTELFDTYTSRLEAIRNSVSEGQAITSQFRKGSEVAARCWYDPRISHIQMDPMVAMIFAETIAEYVDALQWCSGAEDFAVDGFARVGWEKVVEPLIRASE